MSNYTGYRCPVCGKAFIGGEDIVVCPDCGAPHHRECYRSLGHCAYEERHALGEQWSPAPFAGNGGEQAVPQQQATILCPRCGSHNPAGNIFCQVCGQQLTAGQPSAPAYGPYSGQRDQGYRPSAPGGSPWVQDPGSAPGSVPPPWVQSFFAEVMEEPEIAPGISNREVCDYVGPNNLVFLMRFQRLTHSSIKISLNWCAFFFSFFYCFYRKMYKLGAALMCVTIASMIPMFLAVLPILPSLLEMFQQGILTAETLAALPAAQQLLLACEVYNVTRMLVSFCCGMFFNQAYARQVCRGIRAVRERGHCSSGSPEYHYALARQGGVNLSAVLVTICSLIVLYILVCVGLTYQLM